jgi:hypothetical protein
MEVLMPSKTKSQRRGLLAIELLFALPLIIALLLGMIQFSLFLSARQQVTNATREGARVLALGGNADEVRLAVDRFLGPQLAHISATLTDINGDPIVPGQPVEIIVRVPTKYLVPDMLGMIGFGWGDSKLISKAVMRKE